jgi:hypothetical protein
MVGLDLDGAVNGAMLNQRTLLAADRDLASCDQQKTQSAKHPHTVPPRGATPLGYLYFIVASTMGQWFGLLVKLLGVLLPILLKKTWVFTGMPFMALVTIRIRFVRMVTVKEREFIGLVAPIAQIRNRLLEQRWISGTMRFMAEHAFSHRDRTMDPPLRVLKIWVALIAQMGDLRDQLHRARKTFSVPFAMTVFTITAGWVFIPDDLRRGIGIRRCIRIGGYHLESVLLITA